MAISIGDALLHLSVDSTSLDAGLKGVKDKLSQVSTAWAGVGVVILGSMGLMAKSAAAEEANIGRLRIALKNVGISYDSVSDSLEKVISATQRKTGIADSEQRDVLDRLLLVTNDYNKAISLLPLTLDLATAGQMDAATAATYLGKALLDLEGGAKEVTVRLGQASMRFRSLAEIEERVGGAAEAAADPFTVLGAEIGDVGEEIGKVLLPVIRDLIGKFVDVLGKIKDWVAVNPQFVQALAAGALAIGGIIAAVFALKAALLLLGATANIMFGGILILIGALVVGATLLIQSWGAQDRKIKETTATIRAELEKQKTDAIASYAAQKSAAQSLYDSNIQKIREEYGIFKSTSKSKLDLLRDEYDQRIRTANAMADSQISAIQRQIDAIDRQTEQEDLALTRQTEQKQLATLTGTDYTEYAAEIARNELLRTRNAEKDALYAQIEDIRTRAQTEIDTLNANLVIKTGLLDAERIAKEQFELDALSGTTARLANEEAAIKASYDRRLTDYEVFLAVMKALEGGAITPPKAGGVITLPDIVTIPRSGNVYPPGVSLDDYQHGGLIPEPTLLYGLRSMRPYAIAGVAGPERVEPPGGYRTANIYLQLDGRTLAQVIGQPLVDEILIRQGIR